jgi:protein TonB
MALRSLLFSSDSATAEPILQVLAGLGVEGEHCPDAVAAVEKVTHQSFQIVIIDWDQQAEARLLLTSARERKVADRPLTLAIVSDDASVPQALQAGANSILRRPLLINQVKDTLTTARDLLRARQDSATNAAQAAAAAASSTTHVTALHEPAGEKNLRAGEFLRSAAPAPGAQFETETDVHNTLERPAPEPVNPLKELEPMAASVAQEKPAPLPPLQPGETRGLSWYLNARGVTQPPPPASPQPAPPAPQSSKPELLGFDQTPSSSAAAAPAMARSPDTATQTEQEQRREQKTEAALFSYMAGETADSEQSSKPRFRLGKGPIIAALVLAAVAIVAAPQAPWHPKLQGVWGRSKKATHAWLNPQPVTTAPAPASHEDFGRAGDEYKLPVAESIPDATTDPSQIRVTPVVDPTIKKPNNANPDPTQVQPDGSSTNPTDPAQTPAQSLPDNQPPQTSPAPATGTSSAPDSPAVTAPVTVQPHSDPPAVVPSTPPPVAPAPQNTPQRQYVSAPAPAPRVPSSLKSQMASMTPEASGNKPPEAAMASIEPVSVPEAAQRLLLSDQPGIAYPASAKGQQGIVVVQILVGRDGTVQDAKFMQGSLAFARTAIDGVKLWKFKPYTMNGRPVSVQTVMTISFKPGQ